MKTFIIAGIFTLIAASAQAGLSTASQKAAALPQVNAETNSASAVRPAARPVTRPIVKKVKLKKPLKQRRRSDDDDFDRDDD
jgi:hypothetical protein